MRWKDLPIFQVLQYMIAYYEKDRATAQRCYQEMLRLSGVSPPCRAPNNCHLLPRPEHREASSPYYTIASRPDQLYSYCRRLATGRDSS